MVNKLAATMMAYREHQDDIDHARLYSVVWKLASGAHVFEVVRMRPGTPYYASEAVPTMEAAMKLEPEVTQVRAGHTCTPNCGAWHKA
jgi:hypothetical protein